MGHSKDWHSKNFADWMQQRMDRAYAGPSAFHFEAVYSRTYWESGPNAGRIDVVLQPRDAVHTELVSLGAFGGVEVIAPAETMPLHGRRVVHAWFRPGSRWDDRLQPAKSRVN